MLMKLRSVATIGLLSGMLMFAAFGGGCSSDSNKTGTAGSGGGTAGSGGGTAGGGGTADGGGAGGGAGTGGSPGDASAG